ncbi:MAG TPA: retropepsin-like aspartic protease [Candidatus Dormibacteraeota bacterium]|nr:retropepsin-like aspartic protease [Candidatus Dormibacteraeota bacterium]
MRVLLCALAVCLMGAQASVPSSPPPTIHLESALRAYLATIANLHVRDVRRYEERGTIVGLGSTGTFHNVRDGDRERSDEQIGIQTETELRDGDRIYEQNPNGDVRLLAGISLRRSITEHDISSGDFARNPSYDTMLGLGRLADGRLVWIIRVAPPGGETYHVGLDARTFLVDEIAYVNDDTIHTVDSSDYHVVHGLLVPYTQVESDGDPSLDITSRITSVVIDPTIAQDAFAPLVSTTVDASQPVSVPLRSYAGLLFVAVRIHGITANFLLDSGSQGIVISPTLARRLNLVPQGRLQVSGIARTAANGIVALGALHIGSVRVPVHVASVVDLSTVINQGFPVDGVLGYPLFAEAEVRIDPDLHELTIAKPGMLPVRGSPVTIDTDRELPEMLATLNGVQGRFYVDTGDTAELLVFQHFLDRHPGLVSTVGKAQVLERGIGGWNYATKVIVDQLYFGPFRMFHRFASVVLAKHGAFADQNDAGNIGYATLRNFVMTFDLANRVLYLDRARDFDDGRYRPLNQP